MAFLLFWFAQGPGREAGICWTEARIVRASWWGLDG